MAQEQEIAQPITVNLRREPYCDWFIFQIDDGSSEELDPDDAREWFKQRGANMDVVEKALDYCWNFYKATITIKSPRKPRRSPLEPTI
jgi:hypothetical protein